MVALGAAREPQSLGKGRASQHAPAGAPEKIF